MTFDQYIAKRRADLTANKKAKRRYLIGVEAVRLAREELVMATALARATAADARRGGPQAGDTTVSIAEVLNMNEMISAYVPHAFQNLVNEGAIEAPPVPTNLAGSENNSESSGN